ncbi:MAG: hypothetical protein AAB794_04335 [Patescibacteria group bacterium]
MSEFNPSDPKYKKVEDLPENEKGKYEDVLAGGFITKEAAAYYSSKDHPDGAKYDLYQEYLQDVARLFVEEARTEDFERFPQKRTEKAKSLIRSELLHSDEMPDYQILHWFSAGKQRDEAREKIADDLVNMISKADIVKVKDKIGIRHIELATMDLSDAFDMVGDIMSSYARVEWGENTEVGFENARRGNFDQFVDTLYGACGTPSHNNPTPSISCINSGKEGGPRLDYETASGGCGFGLFQNPDGKFVVYFEKYDASQGDGPYSFMRGMSLVFEALKVVSKKYIADSEEYKKWESQQGNKH